MENDDTMDLSELALLQDLEIVTKDPLNHIEQCLPIISFLELKSWVPPSTKHATAALRKRVHDIDSPKLLVCHDMKGGYLFDRFVEGVHRDDQFHFVHWSVVDIFVYFSHHLVTIPPCSWISAAHRNGVKILGTFITENSGGEKLCNAGVLEDESSVHHICSQLAKIASYYNFDGWLINIENNIEGSKISLLKQFVNLLTSKMHEIQPGSQVIWYDSVIDDGSLKWQNALNKHNSDFFHGCDGIYLNYTWKEEELDKSLSVAGVRKTDVFVGIDVFGRGCLGGGGFATNIAVEIARKYGFSVAIFAPGWVHENLGASKFKENNWNFWNSLEKFCIQKRFQELPFCSSFCPGSGKKMFRDGEIISSDPWFNLSIQQPQPIFFDVCDKNSGFVSLWDEDAYIGGGCLKYTATNLKKAMDFKVLLSSFSLKNTTSVIYAYKNVTNETDVAVKLHMKSHDHRYTVCLGGECDKASDNKLKFLKPKPDSESKLMETTFPSIHHTSWSIRNYELKSVVSFTDVIEDVSIQIQSTSGYPRVELSVLLGELKIFPVIDFYHCSYKELICIEKNTESVNVQCVLEWMYHPDIFCTDVYILINDSKQYMGTTSQFSYRVNCTIPKVSVVTFVLKVQFQTKTKYPMFINIPLNVSN